MIKAITITNHLGESVRLDLKDPESSGFVIKKIDGLGPVKANINFTELATSDGAIDNSARVGSRNIVMELAFLEHPTIENTRLLSYKYFPVKKNITFMVETDSRLCETIGRIESNEPDIFSDKEGCQISIMSPDPYLYSKENKELFFYGTEPTFEFPFGNESLTEPLLEFGSIKIQTGGTIYYDGDVDVGITIKIHAVGVVEGFTIYNVEKREIMRINDDKFSNLIGSGIRAGDDIIIKTNRGEKNITLIRSGVAINILNVLDRPISWFQLSKGINTFVYSATNGITNVDIKIDHKVVYEGV